MNSLIHAKMVPCATVKNTKVLPAIIWKTKSTERRNQDCKIDITRADPNSKSRHNYPARK